MLRHHHRAIPQIERDDPRAASQLLVVLKSASVNDRGRSDAIGLRERRGLAVTRQGGVGLKILISDSLCIEDMLANGRKHATRCRHGRDSPAGRVVKGWRTSIWGGLSEGMGTRTGRGGGALGGQPLKRLATFVRPPGGERGAGRFRALKSMPTAEYRCRRGTGLSRGAMSPRCPLRHLVIRGGLRAFGTLWPKLVRGLARLLVALDVFLRRHPSD